MVACTQGPSAVATQDAFGNAPITHASLVFFACLALMSSGHMLERDTGDPSFKGENSASVTAYHNTT